MGLSARELAVLGSGLFVSIFFRLAGMPGAVAFVPFALSAVLAKAKVGSRPVLEWVPLLTSWAAAGVTGRRRWAAPLPLLPTTDGAALPPALRGVEVREIPVGGDGRTMAVVSDRRGTRLTVVLAVRGGQFAASDTSRQDGMLEGWGTVLSSFAEASSPVVQVGWSEMATPDVLASHRDWCATRLTAVGVGAGDPDGYLALVDELSGVATAHRTVVWLTVDGQRARDVKGRPASRAEAHLPVAVDNLEAALFDAGLESTGPMGAAELRQLLRERIDPCDPPGPPNPSTGSLAERLGLTDAETGPMAVSTAWSQMRMDTSFHRTLWVASWPRRPVAADWLNGFLVAGTSRTMTVIHRPVDPTTSQRRIESQLAKLAAHTARKEEKDRRVTEADRRTEEAVHELEAEVASGYSEVLYLGLVTVSAPTLDALDEACRHTVQSARTHGIGLRVLYGRQDVAWAASLPFGLVEPGLLEVMGL
jgi:hypothetical protein